jgi:hypothetical protein
MAPSGICNASVIYLIRVKDDALDPIEADVIAERMRKKNPVAQRLCRRCGRGGGRQQGNASALRHSLFGGARARGDVQCRHQLADRGGFIGYHSGTARSAEHGIQMHIQEMSLDSGFAPSAHPGMTKAHATFTSMCRNMA